MLPARPWPGGPGRGGLAGDDGHGPQDSKVLNNSHRGRFQRPLGWLLGLFGALTAGFSLGGCAELRRQLPVVVYVAVGLQEGHLLDRDTADSFASHIRQFVHEFGRLHPNVLVQTALYPETELREQIRRRNASGLGPDLILTSADLANALLQQGLVSAMPLDQEERNQIDPALLDQVIDSHGHQAGQPLVLFTQLACFDRRRVPTPPATLKELLAQTATGTQVGLSLELGGLLWSAGSLGGLPGINAAARGLQPSPEQKQGLVRWLRWLQEANNQQRVTFLGDQASLRQRLAAGSLDWISCQSSDLDGLRRSLGSHLGISTLPDGEGQRASPLNNLRVLALGRNSSRHQRAMAIALARYSLKPLVQKTLTLDNRSFLPANRYVNVPVQSSQVLATMVGARQRGESSEALVRWFQLGDPRVKELEAVLVPLVFGVIEPEAATEAFVTILQKRR